MRFLITVSAAIAFLLATSVFAETIKFVSPEIFCASCAKKLTRLLKTNERVKDATVDVEHKTVSVRLKKGKTLSDAEVSTLIEPLHYTAEKFERN